MKICFFVSPIGEDGSTERKNSDAVMNYFLKPICKEFGYELKRSDLDSTIEKIDQSIIDYLKNSELVICDLTGHNPNVFYEFGYRQALHLPLIPIITKGEKIPLDVSTLRTIHYVTNDISVQDDIKQRLTDSFTAIQTDLKSIPNTRATQPQPSAPISQSLLTIQDKLDEIKELVQKNNADEIDRISQQVAKYARPAMSDDAAMASSLFSAMFSNPEVLKEMMKLGNSDD